jgi:ABC-type glutathione transport system ATPase component
MLSIALATQAALAPGRLNKQASMDGSRPRRDSEDEDEHHNDPGHDYDPETDVESPAVGMVHKDSMKVVASKAGPDAVAVSIKRALSIKKVVKDLELCWDISLDVPTTKKEKAATGSDTKPILQKVGGVAKSGQMWAVMGSSGAGKSSFLDCLSLRNQAFTGNVFVNKKPANEEFFFMTGE